MGVTLPPLSDRYVQRANSCLFTEAKQTDLEVAGVEVGYTDGVANAATEMDTATTYQKILSVPFSNEDVLVRAWFLNGKTSPVTQPGSSVSWSSGVNFSQDHPTTDGSTVNPFVLDKDPFTIPAAATDSNAKFTSKGYTRTAGSTGVPGVVTLTVTGHGLTRTWACYVSSATDTALNGMHVFRVVDANTLACDNPNTSTVIGTLTIEIQTGYQGVGYSNWQRVKILAPTDGGSYGYLYGRMYPSVALNSMFFRTDLMALDTNCPRLKDRGKTKVGANWLTTTTGSFNASPGSLYPFNVQIASAKTCVTIAFAGDSLASGAGSTSSYTGWPQISCEALSTLARPVVCNTWGWTGQTMGQFFGRAMNMLDYPDMRPDILVIQIGGENKGGLGWGSEGASWAWSQTLQLVVKCQQKGVIPVIRTVTPTSDLSAADDLVRKQYNALARAAASTGLAVIDFTSLVTVAGTPETLNPTYAATSAHLNDAGHILVAPVAVAALSNLIRKR